MQASFDYQAFGIGVKRVREIRELTLREFSCLAEVNKETIRRVESGVPCSDRTREKIRRTLNTSLQRLCLLSRSDESKISIHRADATNWIISKDRRPYAKNADSDINPPIYVESNLIQNCSERNRLGILGFATRFLKLFDCDRQGGRVFAGLMEVYDRGDAKSHPGEEFIYCIRGDIRLLLNETEHILTEGCAITFDARLPTTMNRCTISSRESFRRLCCMRASICRGHQCHPLRKWKGNLPASANAKWPSLRMRR